MLAPLVWKASCLLWPAQHPPDEVYLHLGLEEAYFLLQLLVFPDQPLQALLIFSIVQGLDQGSLGRNVTLLVLPFLQLPVHC